jgi:succinate dehydrogenase / fumarate reductase flavoprotein subunit
VTNYLAGDLEPASTGDSAFDRAQDDVEDHLQRLIDVDGTTVAQEFHREMGLVMLDKCGMSRDADGLREAIAELRRIRADFWSDVRVDPGVAELNQSLEYANRVSDFLELGELMCRDALEREESCGGHFREEHQYPDGECKRDDENFGHVAAWEFQGEGQAPLRNIEPLNYESVKMSVRSYK